MDKAFKGIYKGKKVLVTGHTGFKGCWLCTWLRELGADVIGYSLEPPSIPNNFKASKLENRLIHIHGDVRDLEHLLEVFEQYEPDIVLHLAAQSLVRFSYVDPKCTFDTNVGGTVNIIESVRRTPSVRAFINVTSDKCYEKHEWVWGYREQDPVGGHDPYSASKGCAELVFAAYQQSFFSSKLSSKRKVGVASVRAGNAIGGGDWGADRIIPDCVRALSNSQPISIRNPQAIRPWQHVLEPLSGYLWLGALLLKYPDKFSGAWNFGPRNEDTRTVQELVEDFIKLWGSGSWTDIAISEVNSLYETTLLKLCCDKAHAYLKWYTCLTFEEALQLTVQWYKDYYQSNPPPDMYTKCVTQIQEYISSARKKKLAWANGQQ
ncbi:MAG: CDP-glucose 4,6-dehydratase [Candidatus Hodarchaeota archaeon]